MAKPNTLIPGQIPPCLRHVVRLNNILLFLALVLSLPCQPFAVTKLSELERRKQFIATTFAEAIARDSDVQRPADLGLTLSEVHAERVGAAMEQAAAQGRVWAPLAGWGTDQPQDSQASTNAAGRAGASAGLQLACCVNEQFVRKNVTWDSAMADDLPSVEVAGVWMTSKPHDVPVTLVTQSTVDRIPQLYSQCKSWQGPMAVVFFLALEQPDFEALSPENEALLQRAILHVSTFYEEVERDRFACKPDILLAYEVYGERRAILLYPINLLRNLARLLASTPLLALVDVDMLLSSQVYEGLKRPNMAQALVQAAQNKDIFVLPAFETYGSEITQEAAALADVLVSRDKGFLSDAVKRGIAGPFDSRRFAIGHACTDFTRWYSTNQNYPVVYEERYEPWVIVDRHKAPWHDVRFRGYGNNKIQHIAHLNASGFRFVVMANAFIIHRAHKETSARMRLVASKAAYDTAVAIGRPVDTSSVYGHTRHIFDQAKELMALGQFSETLDPATINCRQKLHWWKLPASAGLLAR